MTADEKPLLGEKIMNTETQILATTILSIADGNTWVSGIYPETNKLIESYIEDNKLYETVEDEYGDTEKVFTGYKDEKLNLILKHILTSCEKDQLDTRRFEKESNHIGKDKLELIKKITKPYALKTDDEK